MKVERVDEVAAEIGPGAALWGDVQANELTLAPVPLTAVDTSKYVRETMDETDIGAVDELTVRAAHDGQRLAINLEWPDASCDDTVTDASAFADKAAVAFPLARGASIMTMGSTAAPINAWYWRADRSAPYDVLARGIGRTERREAVESGLSCRSRYRDGEWGVVFSRRFAGSDSFADFTTEPPAGVAFALWEGGNDERGPLKSYSGEFKPFNMER